MSDIILDGYMNAFAEENGWSVLSDDKKFELFVASSIFRRYHQCDLRDIDESSMVIGGGANDGGIDSAAVLVNGRPARSVETVNYLAEKSRGLDVEFVFVQAKRSPNFSASDIGTFIFGVNEFFSTALGKESEIKFNHELRDLIDLVEYLYKNSRIMRENPKCFLYYATAGSWNTDPEPSARITAGVDGFERLKIFSDVKINPLDSTMIKQMSSELERTVEREVQFGISAVFPEIDGVDEAYVGLLSGAEFLKLVSTTDGQLNRDLFYDNVRDFQGNNPVNNAIGHTLEADDVRGTFPLLNNGITIVAQSVRRTGNAFTISDFQIVNGCQTTHVIFANKGKVQENTYIPVKLVVTRDKQIVNDVIRATNQQTAVLPEALESLTEFHKELENFYNIQNRNEDYAHRVFYERRSKQYAMDNIGSSNIVSLTAQIKSFISMFLNEPHSHPRYYGELLKAYEDRIFVEDHRSEPYYASGASFLMLDRWSNLAMERNLRPYRYHMLMILRILVAGYQVPRMNSRNMRRYSMDLVQELRANGQEKWFPQAREMLEELLSRFYGTSTIGQNPPHRLRAFTGVLLAELTGTEQEGGRKRVEDGGVGDLERAIGRWEEGEIKMFDDWRNFGFIFRQGGGEIFFHTGSIKAIPWNMRCKGTKVRYRVQRDRRFPDRIGADEVETRGV